MPRFFKFDRVRLDKVSDETGNRKYIGKSGTIKKVFRVGAGVGESPTDPFYFVRFDDGYEDGYWGEELTLKPGQIRNRRAK